MTNVFILFHGPEWPALGSTSWFTGHLFILTAQAPCQAATLAGKAGHANFGSRFCRLICVESSIFRRQFPGCVVGVAGPASEGPGQRLSSLRQHEEEKVKERDCSGIESIGGLKRPGCCQVTGRHLPVPCCSVQENL